MIRVDPMQIRLDQTKAPVGQIQIPADRMAAQLPSRQMTEAAPVGRVPETGQAVTDLEGVDRVEVVQVEEVTQLGEAAQEDRAPVAGDREAISLKK